MKDGLKSVKDQSVILSFTPSERFSTDYRLNNAGIFLDVMTSHCRKQNSVYYLGTPSQAVRLSGG